MMSGQTEHMGITAGSEAGARTHGRGRLPRGRALTRRLGPGAVLVLALLLACSKDVAEPGTQSAPAATPAPEAASTGDPAASGPSEGALVQGAPDGSAADPAPPLPTLECPPSRYATEARVVAFGDVHGDITATRRVLRLIGAIDASDRWVGRELVVVQTGDQLDRGPDEQEILDLFAKLRVEAAAAGGAFFPLNGNHETMNVLGDMRYVTPRGFRDFEDAVSPAALSNPVLAQAPEHARARLAAFLPGGRYARQLASRNVAMIVGDSVFVHGGVTPRYAKEGLDAWNAETQAWMRGEASEPPAAILDPEGPVWTRRYSDAVDDVACRDLLSALEILGVERMVVGHTVQEQGITSACDGKVWRIDVGLAAHYGSARAQALEIHGDEVRVVEE